MKTGFIATLIMCLISSATTQAAEILCDGVDANGQEFAVQMLPVKSVLGVNGVIRARTAKGISTLEKKAGLADLNGKEPNWDSGKFNRDLYIEGDRVFLNLLRTGSQKYTGELCAPHNNITLSGIVFKDNDCLAVTCKARGLSALR